MGKFVSISILAMLAALGACSSTPTSESPRGEEEPCGPSLGVDDAGKNKCPQGCHWSGETCKKDRGVIILQAGSTQPTTTAAPTSAPSE